MTQAPPTLSRPLLAGLAEFLKGELTTVIEQWLLIVRRDTQIQTADRLPKRDLVDHLPRLHAELCEFLSQRDAEILVSEVRRDAVSHGELRWQDGYRIDELLRELEAFRHLVLTTAFRYRSLNPDYHGALESSAHALIHQFFAEVTVASARQFMEEQQLVAQALQADLKATQEELGRSGLKLAEMRELLRRAPGPLAEYAELGGGEAQVIRATFDPRELFSGIVTAYKPAIEAKGLRLLTNGLSAPESMIGDRQKIARVAGFLLDNALQNTAVGHIEFGFLFQGNENWVMTVSDTSEGVGAAAPTSERDIGFAVVKQLVAVLGGSMVSETQSGSGTRIAVSLPLSAN